MRTAPAGSRDAFLQVTSCRHLKNSKKYLDQEYGNRVDSKLTLIDEGAPEYIRTIIETEYPPLPMVLVNGHITRIGRISLDRIKKEIEKEL